MSKAKPLAVWFADSHLDLYNWATASNLRYDSIHAFRFIVNHVKKLASGPDDIPVFCAGDFWDDRKPASEVIETVRKLLDRLRKHGGWLYYIQGQHDLADPPWLNAISNYPEHLHGRSLVLPGRPQEVIYGLDWTPGHQLAKRLAEIPPETTILMCHQVWEDLMGSHVRSEGAFHQIPHVHTVFTGDYHACRFLTKFHGASGQPLTVVSPGSTNLRSITETPAKFFFVLDSRMNWNPVRIPTRPVVYAEVTSEQQLQDFMKTWPSRLSKAKTRATARRLPEELSRPILYVRYWQTPELDHLQVAIDQLVADQAFVFYKPLSAKEEDGGEDSLTGLNRKERRRILEAGVAGCLHLALDPAHPEYETLKSLICSRDPAIILQELHQQRLQLTDAP